MKEKDFSGGLEFSVKNLGAAHVMFAGTAYLSTSELHKTCAYFEKVEIGEKLDSYETSKPWFMGVGEGYSLDLIVVVRVAIQQNKEIFAQLDDHYWSS